MTTDRKAQSALEYLMTYGWAILIIVLVGAALFLMGVFNPGGSTTMNVKGLSHFQIDDALLKPAGNLTLVMGVKTGKTTRISDIDYSAIGLTCNNTADDTDVNISPSQTKTISLNPGTVCSLSSGDQVRLSVNITYRVSGSSLTHYDTGEISLTVQ